MREENRGATRSRHGGSPVRCQLASSLPGPQEMPEKDAGFLWGSADSRRRPISPNLERLLPGGGHGPGIADRRNEVLEPQTACFKSWSSTSLHSPIFSFTCFVAVSCFDFS